MMLWPKTKEEADKLKAEALANQKSKKLEKMHLLYGVDHLGRRCGDCASFRGFSMANTYYKCVRYGLTHGPGTDWRAKWAACGKFEPQRATGEIVNFEASKP